VTTKLEKTIFSQKIQFKNFYLGIFSFLFLLFIQSLDLNQFAASGEKIFSKGEYWRAFVSSFLHADLKHLFHNAFFFSGLAILLNTYFGWWVFPVMSFLTGAIINMITVYFYPPNTALVGVSGVVYFMAAFWLMSFALMERRHRTSHRIIYAIGMGLIFFFPETFTPEVSHLAHGIGFGIGLICSLTYFELNKTKIRSQEVWVELPEILEEDSSYEESSEPLS